MKIVNLPGTENIYVNPDYIVRVDEVQTGSEHDWRTIVELSNGENVNCEHVRASTILEAIAEAPDLTGKNAIKTFNTYISTVTDQAKEAAKKLSEQIQQSQQ